MFSATHRRVLGRVHVVHAENWVVYSYYNDKFRRTEVASLELFEGRVLSNSSAFSSFSAPHPVVDRQAYIYPAHITAMKDTFSEKGMTAKHILRNNLCYLSLFSPKLPLHSVLVQRVIVFFFILSMSLHPN